MAKIRVKQGNNEIEIDSRDFYVDNDTAEAIIESLKHQLHISPQSDVMTSLDNAEFHEPEFSSPSTNSQSPIVPSILLLVVFFKRNDFSFEELCTPTINYC